MLSFFAIALVTAAWTGVLSNILTGDVNVKSPVTINIGEEDVYTLDLFAGESTSIETTTEIHIDGLTGHIAEIKIPDFDGVGITVDYEVEAYPELIFGIPVCVVDGDSYFYIGDPTETLDKGSFDSITTFNTAQNLDTERTYDVETKVIMVESAICESIPEPETRLA